MGRFVDLDERVTAQFYDEECEEWTMQTCTIEDVLDSVCDEYTVLPSAQSEPKWIPCNEKLPTKPGRYLVTQKRHYGLYVMTVYFDGNEFFDEAVAWMSPPEPYRGEGGNA